MSTCWDDDAQELVHKAHQPTGQTWEEEQGTAVITWEVWRCQCGQHTMDVRKSVR